MLLKVIKIGGGVIESDEQLAEFASIFTKVSDAKVLVHGGGKTATRLSSDLGIEPKMVEGRRITDAETLKIVTMVYAGLLNKKIVSWLQARGCNAFGLSGADGNAILSHKRKVKEIDYGFAGDVDLVNHTLIDGLLKQALTPVFCALTHDQQGNLLNTNADTIATEVAISMSELHETELIYVFEKDGVLADIEDETSVIPTINYATYQQMKLEGKIFEGMIPKLDNAFRAIQQGVSVVRIGSSKLLTAGDSLHTKLVWD